MIKKSIVIQGLHQKPILIDYRYLPDGLQKPIIIFCHGYKGFKDWGAWNLMANALADEGFCFIKFNFSHNGGTKDQPIDFPDLEAFGNNNYTKELDDLDSVINWVCANLEETAEANINTITLLGHSRGGGIVIIKAAEDSRVKTVISLAGVSDYKNRFPVGMAFNKWKDSGVYFVENARTKQQMPHHYQFYEDFAKNEKRLTIQSAAKNLNIPFLIIHGDADTSVSIQEAQNLHQWNPNSTLQVIKGANHVFGAAHPWRPNYLPKHLEHVVNLITQFNKKLSN